ncbi:MAG: metallophosphoesterase [Planctomycetota bacterium]
MRILASSDLHGFPDYTDAVVAWALEHSPDAVVLAGDLLRPLPVATSLEASFHADARRMAAAFEPVTCSVYYIMGNDDLVDWDPPQENIESIHGRRVEQGGWAFVGYEYTLPLLGLKYERSEKRIAADLKKLAPLIDDRTVLVTHAPAKGVHEFESPWPMGIVCLADLIRERSPRIHIHGHIHRTFGRTENRFNVACRDRARAMLIDLDDLTHEVLEG